MTAGRSERGRGHDGGFTLIELCIVATVLAILAVVGVPQYSAALRTARIGKATYELRTIASAVDTYRAINGELPLALGVVGFGGKADPWGNPYCFLNYEHGTGDGWAWAVDQGLLDENAGKNAKGAEFIGDLALREVAMAQAQGVLQDFVLLTDLPVPTMQRSDQFSLPLNSDYDLFSIGPDCRSSSSLANEFSLDDVIRANNGGYFGLGKDY
ncbi:MAG: type II secretion system protein [Planctomycetota bacterium]